VSRRAPIDEIDSLVELLRRHALDAPDRIAYEIVEPRRPTVTVTFGELEKRAHGAALALRAAGVRAGDRVLLILPTGSEFVEQFFGALLLGAVPVPLAPPYSMSGAHLASYGEGLAAIARSCQPAAVIAPSKLRIVVGAPLRADDPRRRILVPERLEGRLDVAAVDPDSTAMLQYTSGSTSQPKGVVLSHRNIIANAAAIVDACDHTDMDADLTVSWLPLYHDMGLIGTLLTSLLSRVRLVLIPPQAFVKDPACWLRALSDYGGTISVAPNFAFGYAASRIAAEDLEGVRLDKLRILLNGAEPIDLTALERFEARFRSYGLREHVVRPVYGLAENTLAVTFTARGPLVVETVDTDALERHGALEAHDHAPRERIRAARRPGHRRRTRLVSVGRPIGRQQVRIVDRDGTALPEGRVGEIAVRGPSVMRHYFQRPEDSARALRDGWLHTGDFGVMRNGHLFVCGRKKDLIIRHGRNYYPQDIECHVQKLEGVRKGGVVAFSMDEEAGTKVVVVVEATSMDESAQAKLAEQIRRCVYDAFLFAPDDVRVLPKGAIPKTTSGKVRRQECKSRYLDGRLGVSVSAGRRLAHLARLGLGYVRFVLAELFGAPQEVEETCASG
jgi:acyl-CoA synthetase (AMP-forming)/AMP-acid ligase II